MHHFDIPPPKNALWPDDEVTGERTRAQLCCHLWCHFNLHPVAKCVVALAMRMMVMRKIMLLSTTSSLWRKCKSKVHVINKLYNSDFLIFVTWMKTWWPALRGPELFLAAAFYFGRSSTKVKWHKAYLSMIECWSEVLPLGMFSTYRVALLLI